MLGAQRPGQKWKSEFTQAETPAREGRAGAKLPPLLEFVVFMMWPCGHNSHWFEGVPFPGASFEANYPTLSQLCAGVLPSLPWLPTGLASLCYRAVRAGIRSPGAE